MALVSLISLWLSQLYFHSNLHTNSETVVLAASRNEKAAIEIFTNLSLDCNTVAE